MIDAGHGVKLGPFDRAHIEQARQWRNTPAIFRWCRQRDLISDLDQELWFERQNADPATKMYVIYAPMGQNPEERPVGVCGLTSIDLHNRRAEFSLYVAPQFRGQKYGKRALMTLLNHAFRSLGLNGVWGETFEGNPAIRRFEEIGMTREGTRREFYFKDGHYIDCHLYSMLAREWFERVPPRLPPRTPGPHLPGAA